MRGEESNATAEVVDQAKVRDPVTTQGFENLCVESARVPPGEDCLDLELVVQAELLVGGRRLGQSARLASLLVG